MPHLVAYEKLFKQLNRDIQILDMLDVFFSSTNMVYTEYGYWSLLETKLSDSALEELADNGDEFELLTQSFEQDTYRLLSMVNDSPAMSNIDILTGDYIVFSRLNNIDVVLCRSTVY
jgi:hypothetical protein